MATPPISVWSQTPSLEAPSIRTKVQKLVAIDNQHIFSITDFIITAGDYTALYINGKRKVEGDLEDFQVLPPSTIVTTLGLALNDVVVVVVNELETVLSSATLDAVALGLPSIQAFNKSTNISVIKTVHDQLAAIIALGDAASAITTVALSVDSVNSFADKYSWGDTDPTLRHDGTPLENGDLTTNTTSGAVKVWWNGTWRAAFSSVEGALVGVNDLADLSSVAQALVNLGLTVGADVQAYSPVLDEVTTAGIGTGPGAILRLEFAADDDGNSIGVLPALSGAKLTGIGSDSFVSGTGMAFFQTIPPEGWTQVTTANDAALRVVSGVGGGITVDGKRRLSSDFNHGHNHGMQVGYHSLTAAENGPHSHTIALRSDREVSGQGGAADDYHISGASSILATSSSGIGRGHNHPLLGGVASATMAGLAFVDMIICTKN